MFSTVTYPIIWSPDFLTGTEDVAQETINPTNNTNGGQFAYSGQK